MSPWRPEKDKRFKIVLQELFRYYAHTLYSPSKRFLPNYPTVDHTSQSKSLSGKYWRKLDKKTAHLPAENDRAEQV